VKRGKAIGEVHMGNSEPQKMDIEGLTPADLPGPRMSGMAQVVNSIAKCYKEQVIRNTEEETRLQEEKNENAEDRKQNSKHPKKMKLEIVGNSQSERTRSVTRSVTFKVSNLLC
jgi:hypothetical protein